MNARDSPGPELIDLPLRCRAASVRWIAFGSMLFSIALFYGILLLMHGSGSQTRVDPRLPYVLPCFWFAFECICVLRTRRFSHYLKGHDFLVCLNCAYPLESEPIQTVDGLRCPECGLTYDQEHVRHAWKIVRLKNGWYPVHKP